MGWNSHAEQVEVRNRALELLREHGEALTWEQAQEGVLSDTLEFAQWDSLRESGLTPYEALRRLKFVKPEEIE